MYPVRAGRRHHGTRKPREHLAETVFVRGVAAENFSADSVARGGMASGPHMRLKVPLREQHREVAKYRARAATASVETQWTKTLRSPWVLPPPPRPASSIWANAANMGAKPGQMDAATERLMTAGDAAVGRRQPFQQQPPRRLAPISRTWGNEEGNPSYYPLPLGRHLFSSRWVPLGVH